MAGPSVKGHVVICVPSVVRPGIRLGEGASSGPQQVPTKSAMWNPKRNDTNELIYKTETDSQT